MTWLLTICTWGILGVCSQHIEHTYPSEDSCYRAMNHLYKSKGEGAFLYIHCRPENVE